MISKFTLPPRHPDNVCSSLFGERRCHGKIDNMTALSHPYAHTYVLLSCTYFLYLLFSFVCLSLNSRQFTFLFQSSVRSLMERLVQYPQHESNTS